MQRFSTIIWGCLALPGILFAAFTLERWIAGRPIGFLAIAGGWTGVIWASAVVGLLIWQKSRKWLMPHTPKLILLLGVLILIEGMLQIVWISRTGRRLVFQYTVSPNPVIPDDKLSVRGNPFYPDHDAWGFRNPSVPRQADLVALGDSQTYGINARTDHTWVACAAQMAGYSSCYNMGLHEYCPVQSLAWLDQALSLNPRCVVTTLYLGNDAWDAFNMTYYFGYTLDGYTPLPQNIEAIRQAEQKESYRELIARTNYETWGVRPPIRSLESAASLTQLPVESLVGCIRSLCLIRSLYYTLTNASPRVKPLTPEERWEAAVALAHKIPGGSVYEDEQIPTVFANNYRLVVLDRSDPRVLEGFRINLHALNRIRQRCAERGVTFLVLLLPTVEAAYAPLMQRRPSNPTFNRLEECERAFREEVYTYLSAHGIRYVDALPALQDALQRRIACYPANLDGHPTEKGYEVIARCVSDALKGNAAPKP